MTQDTEFGTVMSGLSFGDDLPDSLKLQVIAILLAIGRHERLGPGTVLLQLGDRETNHGFVLLQGSVRVLPEDRETVIVRAPTLLGEAKQFSMKCQRDATVIANGTVDILRFEWDQFEDELRHRLEPAEQREVTDCLIDYAWSR